MTTEWLLREIFSQGPHKPKDTALPVLIFTFNPNNPYKKFSRQKIVGLAQREYQLQRDIMKYGNKSLSHLRKRMVRVERKRRGREGLILKIPMQRESFPLKKNFVTSKMK